MWSCQRESERVAQRKSEREERINRYRGRPGIKVDSLERPPVKEPTNESETALLLQAMISSRHPGIDFVIGDYNTSKGVDMVIEIRDKQIPRIEWAEVVFSLDNLFKWQHPHGGYHRVVCYVLGNAKERQVFLDGAEAQLVPKDVAGRYALIVGSDTLDVYVLRELLL